MKGAVRKPVDGRDVIVAVAKEREKCIERVWLLKLVGGARL